MSFSRAYKPVLLGEKYFIWDTSSFFVCLLFNCKVASSSSWSLQGPNQILRQSCSVVWPSWGGALFLLWVFVSGDFFNFKKKILWAVFLFPLLNWMQKNMSNAENKVVMLTFRSIFFSVYCRLNAWNIWVRANLIEPYPLTPMLDFIVKNFRAMKLIQMSFCVSCEKSIFIQM